MQCNSFLSRIFTIFSIYLILYTYVSYFYTINSFCNLERMFFSINKDYYYYYYYYYYYNFENASVSSPKNGVIRLRSQKLKYFPARAARRSGPPLCWALVASASPTGVFCEVLRRGGASDGNGELGDR